MSRRAVESMTAIIIAGTMFTLSKPWSGGANPLAVIVTAMLLASACSGTPEPEVQARSTAHHPSASDTVRMIQVTGEGANYWPRWRGPSGQGS